ncbi:MAG: hypothetical protein ACK56I_29355, partial [bacterium]
GVDAGGQVDADTLDERGAGRHPPPSLGESSQGFRSRRARRRIGAAGGVDPHFGDRGVARIEGGQQALAGANRPRLERFQTERNPAADNGLAGPERETVHGRRSMPQRVGKPCVWRRCSALPLTPETLGSPRRPRQIRGPAR